MKKLLSLFLCVCILLSATVFTVSAKDEYQIRDSEDLINFLQSEDDYEGKVITLLDDIVLYEGSFTIGENNTPAYNGNISLPETINSIKDFKGVFDGQNHTISGLLLYSGLFENCDGATIENLNIVNSLIIGSSEAVGTICAFAKDTKFNNCFVHTIVVGDNQHSAGITGKAENCIFEACRNEGEIHGENAGGLVSYALNSSFKYCYNKGDVIGSESSGGFGNSLLSCNAAYCYNTGNVFSDTSNGLSGGFASRITALNHSDYGYSLKYSYTAGEVTGYKTGEFCGLFNGDIFSMVRFYFEGDSISQADSTGSIFERYEEYCEDWIVMHSDWETADKIHETIGLICIDDLKDSQIISYIGGDYFVGDFDNINKGYPRLAMFHEHIWGRYIDNGNGTETAFCLFDNCNESNTKDCEVSKIHVGSIVEYGLYPQSLVTDESLISELNNTDKNWISYEYYSGNNHYGNMMPSDYMKYADFSFDGTKYRAVYFSEYRPSNTLDKNPEFVYDYDFILQGRNGYFTDTVYYFKFEPVEWKVLDPETGLVMCNSVIDSQAFCNTAYFKSKDRNIYGDVSKTMLASDYSTSSINNWLNNSFYNTAFDENEKSKIMVTEISQKEFEGTDYVFRNSDNKIFLLSSDDVTNEEYGFINNTYRIKIATEYAKCQGAEIASDSLCEYYGTPHNTVTMWLLRDANRSDEVSSVFASGVTGESQCVSYTCSGIVPAMRINLHTHSYQEISRTPATCTEDGEIRFICSCGESYSEILKKNGHSFSEWKTLSEVTTVSAGLEERYCEYCGNAETKTVSKLKPINITVEENQIVHYKETAFLEKTISNPDKINYSVKWSSSDTTVADVDGYGNVNGLKFGKAKITCTVTDEYGNVTNDTCTVKVRYSFIQWIILIFLFGWIWY